MDEKETPPSRFESEMTRMMKTAILSIKGLDSRLANIEKDVSDLKTNVKENGRKLDTLTDQFGNVVSLVIKNDGRLTKLEGEVAELQSDIH